MAASGLEPVPITPQKHDPAWKHCQMFKNEERVQLKCNYCTKLFKGGGIHRIKEHLAGQKGNASTCLRVPPDVRNLMQQSLNGVVVKKRKRQKLDQDAPNVSLLTNGENAVEAFPNHLISVSNSLEPSPDLLVNHEEVVVSNKSSVDRKKRRRVKNSSPAGNDIIAVYNGTGFVSRKVDNQVHMAIGRFLFDIGASLDSVNSSYFQPMLDAIVSAGQGSVPPSYNDLRGLVLKHSLDEVKNDYERCKATWERTGCSVLIEECLNETGQIKLNTFVYCPEGTVFLESIDASKIIESSDSLYELLKKVVEQVGVKNVIQVITGNEDPFIIASKRLTDTYPTLYWTPCSARCIASILEDFGNIEWINTVIEQARSITRFVYNNCLVLNIVRRFTCGIDIIEPSTTRSSTNFCTIKRMVDLKHNLQSMVTSQEWMDCPFSKKPGGLEMLDLVSNQSFWSSCSLITHLTSSLLRVLRIVSSKRRPAMGYVYAGMYRVKEAIKTELVKSEDYMIYWNIIDRRWDQQWHHPLHAAGFYLNPKFFYSIEGNIPSQIHSVMLDCIERLVSDTKVQDKIIKEVNLYKNAFGDLGRKMAIRARDTLLPAEWWSTYGGGCPNLARLAVRILSQTSSLIEFMINKIPLEKIHDMSNHLEHHRISDLVFVHHNLRLKHKFSKTNGNDPTDPISFDCVNSVEEWVSKKNLCLEDCGSLNWTALDPPSASTLLLGPSNDDAEDLGTGFYDSEIFKRTGEEENILDNVVSQ